MNKGIVARRVKCFLCEHEDPSLNEQQINKQTQTKTRLIMPGRNDILRGPLSHTHASVCT